MSNPLDHKPFKNVFAGKGVKTKQHFKPNSNLSGYGKGSDVTVKGNKLALPVTRTGSSTGKLVKRTYTDVAPGLQGGLRETVKVLSDIKSFCESSNFGLKNEDGDVIGYVNTAEEAKRAVNDGKAYSYFDKNQMRKSIDARTKVLTGESTILEGDSVFVMADNSSLLVPELLKSLDSLGITLKDNQERGRYELSKDGVGSTVWYHGENSRNISSNLLRAIKKLGFTAKQIGHGWEYEIAPTMTNESNDPFQALITRVRHARKTGDKAKEVQAQDELHRLATRHNRMKDPEVLDALSESKSTISEGKSVFVMADNSSLLVPELLKSLASLGITLRDNEERGSYELSKDGVKSTVWYHGENSRNISSSLLRAIKKLGFDAKQIGHGWEYEITPSGGHEE